MEQSKLELLKIIIPAISALISAIAVAVSLIIFRRNVRANSKPVLVFTSRGEETRWGWKLQNYGNGAALNIIVAEGVTFEDMNIVNCYPLSSDASVDLIWMKKTAIIVATYSNIFGEQFTSICQNNQTKIEKGNKFPTWKSYKFEWIETSFEKNRKYLNSNDLEGYIFKSEKDLESLTDFQIDTQRNLPYARHGYQFKRKDLRDYFSKMDWYNPLPTDLQEIESKLTVKEKAISNLLLIYQIRKKNENKIR